MGEFELLARIRERLPAAGPRVCLGSGDDGAVTLPEGATATSVDALVDGVHFRRDTASPSQIGHKALATALSDLAAMGAEPGEAYVVLGIPPDIDESGCLELLDGMVALASSSGTSLAGGDLTRATELFLAITVVGHAASPESFVSRSGAQPGDAVVVTGELGGAAAGLLLLEQPELGTTLSAAAGERLRASQLEPQPRLAAGRVLANHGATAMIDLSDGLGGDARHLAERSGVGLRIDASDLPVADGVAAVAGASRIDPLELTVTGGEDYELLATLPAEKLAGARRALAKTESPRLTEVGEVVDGKGVEIRLPGGRLLESAGFDQLA